MRKTKTTYACRYGCNWHVGQAYLFFQTWLCTSGSLSLSSTASWYNGTTRIHSHTWKKVPRKDVFESLNELSIVDRDSRRDTAASELVSMGDQIDPWQCRRDPEFPRTLRHLVLGRIDADASIAMKSSLESSRRDLQNTLLDTELRSNVFSFLSIVTNV